MVDFAAIRTLKFSSLAAFTFDWETSDAGSQYRCGRLGRGVKPPSHPPHIDTHKKYPKRLFFHISTRSLPMDGPMDGPADGPTDGQSLL